MTIVITSYSIHYTKLYDLRPSDVRRLRQADLVIWVGPELERFLVKPLDCRNQGRHNIAFTLADRTGLFKSYNFV